MINKIITHIKSYFNKEEEVESRPNPSAIIRMNSVALENGIFDDENKVIDLLIGEEHKEISYSESDVRALIEQGIPVIEDIYPDDYEFDESVNFGGVIGKK